MLPCGRRSIRSNPIHWATEDRDPITLDESTTCPWTGVSWRGRLFTSLDEMIEIASEINSFDSVAKVDFEGSKNPFFVSHRRP